MRQVALQPAHWNCNVADIQAKAAGNATAGVSAVVVPPSRRQQAAGAGPAPGAPVDHAAVMAVLHQAIAKTRSDIAYPDKLQKTLYTALRDLLPPRSLKQYIHDNAADFLVVESQQGRAWGFRLRDGSGRGAGVSAAPPTPPGIWHPAPPPPQPPQVPQDHRTREWKADSWPTRDWKADRWQRY